MIFSSVIDETPFAPGEARVCKLTFIGKHLDKPALRAGFESCLATAENFQKRNDLLRFRVGDRVECRTGPDEELDWEAGVVTEQYWRDPTWPPWKTSVPYQVQLESDGGMIFAPQDHPDVVRAAGESRGAHK